jgi:hypothetical protein
MDDPKLLLTVYSMYSLIRIYYKIVSQLVNVLYFVLLTLCKDCIHSPMIEIIVKIIKINVCILISLRQDQLV